MSTHSYEIDPTRLVSIDTLHRNIEGLLATGQEYTKEQLFIRLFSDPKFPDQPIVSEGEARENFELALAGLSKELSALIKN